MTLAVVVVGNDNLSCVNPLRTDTKMVEIVRNDGSGKQLTEGDNLIVVVIIVVDGRFQLC